MHGVPLKEGKSIERVIETMMEGGEQPATQTEPLYTAKERGVLPETDIRNDKWETALQGAELLNSTLAEKRNAEDEKAKMMKYKGEVESGKDLLKGKELEGSANEK